MRIEGHSGVNSRPSYETLLHVMMQICLRTPGQRVWADLSILDRKSSRSPRAAFLAYTYIRNVKHILAIILEMLAHTQPAAGLPRAFFQEGAIIFQ